MKQLKIWLSYIYLVSLDNQFRTAMKLNIQQLQQRPEYYFHQFRWQGNFHCPHCGSKRITTLNRTHHCNACNKNFTDTSGTIFHSTKLPVWKWLVAIYYFIESPRGISSYTLAKYISVSQPTAWRILTLLRSSLHQQLELSDELILDEVYLGCDWHFKPRYKKVSAVKNLEKKKRSENPNWTTPLNKKTYKSLNYQAASADKMIVVGLRDYNKRKLELIHIHTLTQETLLNLIKMRNKGIKHITTDDSKLYKKIDIPRSICRHKIHQYKSDDGYSSNPIENHFSHIRRMWHGIYQWFSEEYCQYYLDEFAFRYNHRDLCTYDKFKSVFCLIVAYM